MIPTSERRAPILVGVILAALASFSCTDMDKSHNVNLLPVAKVKVVPVERAAVSAAEEVMGSVQPKHRSSVSAKISGRVGKVNVALGQRVSAGETLVELEAAEIQAKLEQALALHRQAENDLRRFANLVAQNAATKQDFEAAQARERVTAASVSEAQTMLGYATIRAPFDGVVTQKQVEVGDLAAPGKLLLEISSPEALRFEAEVPESSLGSLRIGDILTVVVAAQEHRAVVSEINAAADPNSRTFLVKLDIASTQGLFIGQFGRVLIPRSGRNALLLPAAAVVRRGQLEIAFVIADNRAQLRLIKTTREEGPTVEVLAGLEEGEIVVIEGAHLLADGQPVEIVQEARL